MSSSPTRKDLRDFAISWTVFLPFFFGLLLPCLRHWWRHAPWQFPGWPWAAAAGCLLVGLTIPGILRWPFWLWMKLALALGWFNTRLILGLFFYLCLTPIGGAMRLAGRDPLRRRWDPAAPTYRQPPHPRPPTHLHHPY